MNRSTLLFTDVGIVGGARDELWAAGDTGAVGGAVFLDSGSCLACTRCLFRGNAAVWGGAVYVNFGASLTCTACSFEDNRAVRAWGLGSGRPLRAAFPHLRQLAVRGHGTSYCEEKSCES